MNDSEGSNYEKITKGLDDISKMAATAYMQSLDKNLRENAMRLVLRRVGELADELHKLLESMHAEGKI